MKSKRKPEFFEGQAVVWCHEAYFVKEVLPLHCVGAAQCYLINRVPPDEREFVSLRDDKRVSEEVLRPLNCREMGPLPKRKGGRR